VHLQKRLGAACDDEVQPDFPRLEAPATRKSSSVKTCRLPPYQPAVGDFADKLSTAKSNRKIAAELGPSRNTVDVYRKQHQEKRLVFLRPPRSSSTRFEKGWSGSAMDRAVHSNLIVIEVRNIRRISKYKLFMCSLHDEQSYSGWQNVATQSNSMADMRGSVVRRPIPSSGQRGGDEAENPEQNNL